jgi:hypothetical protein
MEEIVLTEEEKALLAKLAVDDMVMDRLTPYICSALNGLLAGKHFVDSATGQPDYVSCGRAAIRLGAGTYIAAMAGIDSVLDQAIEDADLDDDDEGDDEDDD